MKYIEVTFTLDDTGVFRDLLIDTLGNEGPYESFVETPTGLKAYVAEDQYDPQYLAATAQAFPLPLKYEAKPLEERNWNAEWESQHAAVLVHSERGSVYVRAPFHPHRNDVDYELIIEPKMSFGTAHHPTTYMMLSYVAELEVAGRDVLDMGCGTGVLGILAGLRGAASVRAIDVDEWAFRNAQENAAANGVRLDISLGNATMLPAEPSFDIILANINRNILLADMPRYAAALRPAGSLLLSGFYSEDCEALRSCAAGLGLTLASTKSREGWMAMQLIKA